jgi:CubicO group peptidase (beta-lactamase class C family)
MTALLAAVAVSQGRIQWTTTIPEVFPELTNVRAEYRAVPLRDLLSHQSGLPGSITPAVLGGWQGLPVVAQRDSAVAWLVQQPPSGSRGTFSYSNWGYAVAGAMLERVFGTPFEAAMAAHVFAPLGMTDAGFGPQAAAGSTTQPVAHYRDTNGSWRVMENHDVPPVMGPSGAAHMSLASWGRLVREVLRVEAGTPTLAPAAIARQTTTAVIAVSPGTSYGLGWGISTGVWANGKVLSHDGSNGANFSVAVLAPQRNVAFLATTNGVDSNGPKAVNGLIGRLIAFHNTGK